MTPARRAALFARIASHEVACITLHGAATMWGGAIAEELRARADEHSRKAKLLRQMMRDGL